MSMMQPRESPKQMLDAIESARDTARVRLHLLSLSTQQRWSDIEGHLLEWRNKLEREGEALADQASVRVHELTEAVRDLVHEVEGTSALAAPASRIMHADPSVCSPEDTAAKAAQIMWERDCGAVPVVARDGALVGIVTDRDICIATYTRGLAPRDISVESVMARDLVSAAPADSLGHVAHLMAERRVRRIPIVEGGKLVGVIALADLARYARGLSKQDVAIALSRALGRISEAGLRVAGN
jgi:CBS domain-containing protein